MDPDFTRPETVEEAVADLQSEGAVAVGGGTQVALLIKHNLLEPSRLVWLGGVRGLTGISSSEGGIVIRSGTTLAEIAKSSTVLASCPALAEAAALVGNARVRAVATMAGHLVHGDPRQDLPPVLLVLDAAVRMVAAGGEREVPLSQFFVGPFETALQEGELVTSVHVPPVGDGTRVSYLRFTPATDNDYPTVGVAARVAVSNGVVRHAVVGLGGVDTRPLRVELPSLTGRAAGPAAWREAGDVAGAACDPSSDQRGSAGYKREMARLWTARALEVASSGS